MPIRIASAYDYQDSRDPSDTFDRFEQPDYEQRDKSGRCAERGQPFTWGEIEYFEFRQGITMCPTPVQQEPKPPGLTKMQEAWALTFDPLAGLDEAMAVCREHINLIKATSGRDRDKAQRVRSTIKGVLSGMIFADVADEMCLDPAFLSRTMADAYAKWPGLERPLRFINLLNNQARRKCDQLSTAWQIALRMGEQIIDDGVLIWGSWPGSGPRNHVTDPDHIVKIAELQHKTFPPIRSNYNTVLASIVDVATRGEARGEVTREAAPSRGAQRVERTYYNKWGYETERGEGGVRIGAFKDRDRLHDSIDTWQRLREFLGLSPTCRWLACHGVLFDMFGHEFFRAETQRRKASRPERPTGLPASFLDVPWINSGFLIPEIETPTLCRAPYIPFVNEHKNDKLKKGTGRTNTRRGVPILCSGVGPWRPGENVVGHWWAPQPKTFKWPKGHLRPTRKRVKRWETKIHNHTKFGPNANSRFKKEINQCNPPLAERFARLQPAPRFAPFNTLGTRISELLPGVHYLKREADYIERDMVAIGPHCYVNARVAQTLGLNQQLIEWPILVPSTHRDNTVLFEPQVTPSIGARP